MSLFDQIILFGEQMVGVGLFFMFTGWMSKILSR